VTSETNGVHFELYLF